MLKWWKVRLENAVKMAGLMYPVMSRLTDSHDDTLGGSCSC
jgi:hypothetical protein